MGGISGFQNIGFINPQNSLASMIYKIQHRGINGSGTKEFQKQNTYIGQVCFHTITTTENCVPLTDSSGRFTIVYDGEIYNFKELRTYLTKKYNFNKWKFYSDNEVILEGYAFEGISFIEKLNGAFALAIFDIKENELFFVRDFMGIRPLYYTEQNEGIAFCSELKGLLALNLKKNLNPNSVFEQMLFMYVPEPYTMFYEYSKCNQGEYRIYKSGKLKKQGILSRSHFVSNNNGERESDYIEQLDYLLTNAVKSQLQGIKPLSVFLSGGLDSSLLVAIALKAGAPICDVYTSHGSKEDTKKDYFVDDLPYAQIVAKQFGLNLHTVEAKKNMLSYLPLIASSLDEAISDPAGILIYLIGIEAQKKGYRILLSGQAADELFGGYRKYQAMNLYHKIPNAILKTMMAVEPLLPTNSSGKLNALFRRSRKFILNANKSDKQRIVELAMWSDPKLIKELFRTDIQSMFEIGKRHFDKLHYLQNDDTINRFMLFDQQMYLPSHNLAYTDRVASMAGIVTRVPFLDMYVVEFAKQLPSKFKLKGQETKYILKKLSERYLPKEIIYRSKTGFGIPIGTWFRTDNESTKKYFDIDRLKQQNLLDYKQVDDFLKKEQTGKQNCAYSLYAMLTFQMWYDEYCS